jgi:hypothetical protein
MCRSASRSTDLALDLFLSANATITSLSPNREKARREFQTSGTHHVALVSLTAGGMGIDLHTATYAVFAELPTSLMWLKQVPLR